MCCAWPQHSVATLGAHWLWPACCHAKGFRDHALMDGWLFIPRGAPALEVLACRAQQWSPSPTGLMEVLQEAKHVLCLGNPRLSALACCWGCKPGTGQAGCATWAIS